MVGCFLVFGCLVSSKCRAADLKHRHKVGLPISEVVLLKAEILWETLYHLKMHLVPCGHICQHSDFKEQEGVAHPHLHQHCSADMSCPLHRQAADIGKPVFPRRVQPGWHHGVSLCPGWLGRARTLAGHDSFGAASALRVWEQPGQGPGTTIARPPPCPPQHRVASLQQHRPGPDFYSEGEKILIFKYHHHFHGHLTL